MECPICEKIRLRKGIIYEDEKAIAFLSEKPLVSGQMIVFPKEHYEEIESINKETLSHLFTVANQASSVIYQLIGGGNAGTNIIVNEGKGSGRLYSHIGIEIIPRKQDDKINFRWTPKPSNPKALDDTIKKLKEETFFVGKERAQEKAQPIQRRTEKIKDSSDDNYLLKQLKRIP